MHSVELSRTECSHLYQVVDKLVRSRLIGFREEHLLHQLVADNDATLVSTFREYQQTGQLNVFISLLQPKAGLVQ